MYLKSIKIQDSLRSNIKFFLLYYSLIDPFSTYYWFIVDEKYYFELARESKFIQIEQKS